MLNNKRKCLSVMNKKVKISLILFFMGGVLGAVIDIFYVSITTGKFAYQGFLGSLFHTFIPFLPAYGFGLVTLYLLHPLVKQWSVIKQFGVYAGVLTLLEFVGGVFAFTVLKTRVWDYSQNTFNFLGHIDLLHTFYWGILGVIVCHQQCPVCPFPVKNGLWNCS